MNALSIEADIASMSLATLLAYRTSYERASAQTHHPPLMQVRYRETLILIHQQIERRVAPPGPAPPPVPLPVAAPREGAGPPVSSLLPVAAGLVARPSPDRRAEAPLQLTLF